MEPDHKKAITDFAAAVKVLASEAGSLEHCSVNSPSPFDDEGASFDVGDVECQIEDIEEALAQVKAKFAIVKQWDNDTCPDCNGTGYTSDGGNVFPQKQTTQAFPAIVNTGKSGYVRDVQLDHREMNLWQTEKSPMRN